MIRGVSCITSFPSEQEALVALAHDLDAILEPS